jgi:DsbC/DsbD-like thiol-disulfide interchange protein
MDKLLMGLPFRPVATAFLLLAGVCTCRAEAVQARHARVELIAQHSAVASSQQLWLGVHFSLERDWHIYWVNPGDSGQPPIFKWQLPTGFKAGEIHWPRPEKLKHSTLADYGYQDDAVLLVPLHVPAGLKAGTRVDIGLEAKWLICREVCISDHAEFHLALPLSTMAARDQNQTSLIDDARRRLPKPWPRSWKASATSETENFVLSIHAGKPIPAAEFYPLAPEQIDNPAAQPLQPTPQGVKITLKKSDQLLKPITVLKGLLVLGDGESYRMQAPVTPAKTKAHND